MTQREFELVNKYLKNEEFAYIVFKKNKLNDKFNFYKLMTDFPEKGLAIHSNVNFINQNCIPLQNIPHPKKGNSMITTRESLLSVVGDQRTLDYMINRGYIFVKERKSISLQRQRKSQQNENSTEKKARINKNVKAIKSGESLNLSRKDWIEANEVVLKSKSTTFEDIIYRKLSKSLKKRVKRQTPFTINGNVYFADICIKCKKLIIEVDGKYHETELVKARDKVRDFDFSSIGYKTIRIKNEDVLDSNKLSDFVNTIINTPNKSKQ